MIRETARAFSQAEIAPRAAEIDKTNQFPRDLWPKMGELGLHGVTVEEEYGGSGLGYLEHVHRGGGGLARLRLGRPLLRRPFQSLRQPDLRRNGTTRRSANICPS
jgi:isovaleryl-CoA dehydrogenase